MSSLRLSGLLFVVLLVVSACQVDVKVDLDVEETGGGTVRVEALFDAEAERVLGEIDDQLRLDDLAAAGWQIDTETFDDGSATVVGTKNVAARDDWQGVLDELAGPGVFTNVVVDIDDSFASAEQRLAFDLDLSEGWDLFSDQGVVEILGGEPFGAPIETLTDGRTIDEVIAVNVTAEVTSEEAGTSASNSYSPRFDSDNPLRVSVTATSENSTAILLRWIAIALFSLFVLAALLAVTGIVLQRRADRLRPAPTPSSLASRVPGGSGSARPAQAATETAASSGPVRLVVLDPLSVLYQQGSSADVYVLPFVRENHGKARADIILDAYNQVLVGKMETSELWDLCAFENASDTRDQSFADERRLRAGAADFLSEMQRRRIPIAGVSNDSAQWSEHMRDRDRLTAVWPWLVSSSVGTGTTDSAMFEVLRRETGISHSHCLYVDTKPESLDVAKELGMKTALFDTGDLQLPEIVGHTIVTDFKGLFDKK